MFSGAVIHSNSSNENPRRELFVSRPIIFEYYLIRKLVPAGTQTHAQQTTNSEADDVYTKQHWLQVILTHQYKSPVHGKVDSSSHLCRSDYSNHSTSFDHILVSKEKKCCDDCTYLQGSTQIANIPPAFNVHSLYTFFKPSHTYTYSAMREGGRDTRSHTVNRQCSKLLPFQHVSISHAPSCHAPHVPSFQHSAYRADIFYDIFRTGDMVARNVLSYASGHDLGQSIRLHIWYTRTGSTAVFSFSISPLLLVARSSTTIRSIPTQVLGGERREEGGEGEIPFFRCNRYVLLS